MKKRIISVLTAIFTAVTFFMHTFAASPVLCDYAGLLNESEFAYVNALLESAGEKHDASFVIVTVNGTDGKNIRDYADDYYDYGGYAYSGILLAIDMAEGKYWFSTSGKYDCYEVNYTALDTVDENVAGLLVDGDFCGAFAAFAEDCARIDELSANGYTGYDSDYDHNYDYDYDYDYDYESHGEEDFKWGSCLLASFIAGLVVAFIVTAVFKGQLKSVKQQTRAENYVVDGSMKVTEASDLFLYRHVTRTARPKNNGGNSSGSHRSSSGRSHGGRGGSFR